MHAYFVCSVLTSDSDMSCDLYERIYVYSLANPT